MPYEVIRARKNKKGAVNYYKYLQSTMKVNGKTHTHTEYVGKCKRRDYVKYKRAVEKRKSG